MPYVIDRLSRVYSRNNEYKQAVKKESEIYEQLKEELEEEQGNRLEEYFSAAKETAGICEKLAYQQGIKDLFSFFASMTSEKEG